MGFGRSCGCQDGGLGGYVTFCVARPRSSCIHTAIRVCRGLIPQFGYTVVQVELGIHASDVYSIDQMTGF